MVDAIEESAEAIPDKQYEMRRHVKFDRMMKMREQGVVSQQKLILSKEKCNNAKRKGASKDTLEQMKSMYKHQRKTSMM